MAVIESGNNTPGTANVDAAYNSQVNLPYTPPSGVAQGGGSSAAGFAALLAENDPGLVTGVRDVKPVEVTTNYRVRVAVDQSMLTENFVGSNLNSTIWTAPVATSTVAVAGNLLTLNNGASLASGSVARVSTYRSFPVLASYPLYATMYVQFSAAPVANMVHECGLVLHSGVSAPTDGAYFTINAAGEFRCVVNTSGTINQPAPLNFSSLVGINTAHEFFIQCSTEYVVFWIDNVKVYEASLSSVSALGIQIGSGQPPLSFRSYNALLVTGTAQLMKVSGVNVTLGEMANNKPWPHIQAGAGMSCNQGQTGQTLGTTALYTNSSAVGAGAAMTNTTAALASGLGGQFTAQPTLAVATDGILQSYQNPVGSVTAPGRTLYITGVRMQAVVSTVLAGNASPVIYLYSLAYGHNNVSLASTTSTTGKAPVRDALGIDTFPAAAALGTVGAVIDRTFNTPIAIFPGEFIQIAAKNIGAVTTSGTITWLVSYNGYWE